MENIKNSFVSENSYLLGLWTFDVASCQLKKGGTEVKLEPLLCDFLQYMISRAGETVTREELLANVWQGRVVSDDAIRRVVKKLRLALGDDAKNPSYIKTKPMKGYVLVADVKELPGAQKNEQASRSVLAVLLGALVFGAVTWAFLKPSFLASISPDLMSPRSSLAEKKAPNIQTRLTSLTGSELVADFHEASHRLVFNVRGYANDGLQLYTKKLGQSYVQRISHEEGNYYRGVFSPSGEQLAFVHLATGDDHAYIYIAEYDSESGISKQQKIETKADLSSLSNWSTDGKSIYYFASVEHEKPWDIYRYNIEQKTTERITYSSLRGYGAFYALESPNGRYLAILKNVVGRRYALVLMDLKDNSLVVERNINFFGDSIVWLKESSAVEAADGSIADLALSSFKGDLYYYSMSSDTLWPQQGTAPGLNDIFYDCGERCFYMRRHTMNYTDVIEIHNPFMDKSTLPTLLLESSEAEFHPIYSRDGSILYYTKKNEQQAAIVQHTLGEQAIDLHQFDPRHITRELVLSPDEQYLAGRIEDRLFLLNLKSREFEFLSSELEVLGPPSWSRDSRQLYFSRVDENSSDLYAYHLDTKKTEYKEANIAYLRELEDGRSYLIDHDLKLHQLHGEEEREYIVSFKHLSGSTWQIFGDEVYYTDLKHGNTYINQLNLKTKDLRTKILAENSDTWEFDLHPRGDRLILTRFQMAQSDLVKVQWPKPE